MFYIGSGSFISALSQNAHPRWYPGVPRCTQVVQLSLSWNSTGKIGRHRTETHRPFNIRFFGPMRPIFPVEFQLTHSDSSEGSVPPNSNWMRWRTVCFSAWIRRAHTICTKDQLYLNVPVYLILQKVVDLLENK